MLNHCGKMWLACSCLVTAYGTACTQASPKKEEVKVHIPCRLKHLTMGTGIVTEHELYHAGCMLEELQEWVLQHANLGNFSGVSS